MNKKDISNLLKYQGKYEAEEIKFLYILSIKRKKNDSDF